MADDDGVGCAGGDGVERVGLGVDDAHRAIGLIHNEGAPVIGGHHTVDGTATDGNGSGIDCVAGGLNGRDLSETAAGAGSDYVRARGGSIAGDVDRREARGDGKLLLKVERLASELGDCLETGVADVGVSALREDADGVGTGEECGLEDLALEERGADAEGGQSVVAVERVAGGAAAVEDEVVGVHADLGGNEDGVAGEVDEGDQTRGGIGRSPGSGDDYGKLLWLGGRSNRIDGADDRAVGVAATGDGNQSRGCQGEAGC